MKHFTLILGIFFFAITANAVEINLFENEFPIFKNCCEKAYLGVHSENVSLKKVEKLGYSTAYGKFIHEVVNNSAADKAGIKPFDYIVGIGNKDFNEDYSLHDAMKTLKPGERATVHFFRDGKKLSTEVKFDNYNSKPSILPQGINKSFLGVSPVKKESDTGVIINVIQDTPAEQMGLKDGDILIEINKHPMIDWQDVRTAVREVLSGETLRILYQRDNEVKEIVGEVGTWQNVAENKLHKEYKGLKQLGSSHAFLGVDGYRPSKKKAEILGFDNAYGTYVTRVIPKTAAEENGFQPFDYIYGIEEYRTGSGQSLATIIRKFEPGDKVEIRLIRQGKTIKKQVKLGSHRFDFEVNSIIRKCDRPFLGIKQDYEDRNLTGVQINVVDGSSADEMGLKNGTIIQSINGFPIVDWKDVTTAISMLEKGDNIVVQGYNGETEFKGKTNIKSYGETKECTDWKDFEKNLDLDIDFDSFDDLGFDKRDVETPNKNLDYSIKIESLNKDDLNSIENDLNIELSKDNRLNVENLTLSPNPNQGQFALSFSVPNRGDTQINVYNSAGRLIYDYRLSDFSGEFDDDIDISQNGSGNYYLEIKQGNRATVRKIILN